LRRANLIFGLILLSSNSFGSPISLEMSSDDRPLVAVSLAHTGLRRSSEFATEARIEYRSFAQFWVFKPFGTLHGFAGLLIDLYLFGRVVITPSFAPGVYYAGRGKDLGFPLEFRSQVELSYRFLSGARIGVGVNHISNAKLGRINPGIEAISITFSSPGFPAAP
jgi:hypothetical protein